MVDLGSAPGSWLQYIAERVGPQGLVVGVDLSEIRISLPDTVRVLRADIFRLEPADLLSFAPRFDILLSDAAPNTTGVVFADSARSVELARRTLELARAVVAPGGAWVCKVFQGEDLAALKKEARPLFERLAVEKPKGSRGGSVELFLVGTGLKESGGVDGSKDPVSR